MINTASTNSKQYQSTFNTHDTARKNDGGFSSALSKQLEDESDFYDMYIRTYQSSIYDPVEKNFAYAKKLVDMGCLQVPGMGDLKELMESIESGLAEGRPLGDILQDRIDRYAREYGNDDCIAVGGADADLFFIDPKTGIVMDSEPKGRCLVWSHEVQDGDYSTVRKQADDLATFIRYTAFARETDDPEKVSALLSELKEKQAGYDTTRFMPIFSMKGDDALRNIEFLRKMLGLDDEDEENENPSDEATDEMIKIVGERNSPDDGDAEDNRADTADSSPIIDLMERMNAENIGKSRVARQVLTEALFKLY